jgi:hypothetical protein
MGGVIGKKGRIPVLSYCANNTISSISEEIKNLINVIRLYRNKSAHSYQLTFFVCLYEYFILFFKINQYNHLCSRILHQLS